MHGDQRRPWPGAAGRSRCWSSASRVPDLLPREHAAGHPDERPPRRWRGSRTARRRAIVSARSSSPRRARSVRHRRTRPPPHTAAAQRWATSATVATATVDPARVWPLVANDPAATAAPTRASIGQRRRVEAGDRQPAEGEHAARGPRRPWPPRRARRRRRANPAPARCRGPPARGAPRASRDRPDHRAGPHERARATPARRRRGARGRGRRSPRRRGAPRRRPGLARSAPTTSHVRSSPLAGHAAERARVHLAVAHAEHRATADRVAVGRDHPVAHHVGAVGQVGLRARPPPPRRRHGRRRPARVARRRRAPARRRGPPTRAR